MQRQRRYWTIVLLVIAISLTGCGGGGESSKTVPVLTTITINPASVSVKPGDTQEFTVIGKDQNGEIMSITPTWNLSEPLGTFSSTRASATTFTAETSGNCTITATVGEVSGSVTVTVTTDPPVLTTISVDPPTASLSTGESQVFTAVGKDQYGSTIPLADTLVWTVTAGIGTVSPNTGPSATFTASTAGSGQVTAAVESISGSANVTISTPRLRVPEDYANIQAAIEAAPDGGTVILSQGTHDECIVIENKSLTLRSADPDDEAVVAATVISGNNISPAIIIKGDRSNTVTIEGFTITQGKGSIDSNYYGGGIYIDTVSATIRKNIISGNSANQGAGIAVVNNGWATIEFNEIINNTADLNGGGTYGAAGCYLIVNNNTISGNRANGKYFWNGGGGIFLNTSAELNNNTITENHATNGAGSGGGIHVEAGRLEVNNCTISSNASGYGGGIFVHNNTSLLLSSQTEYSNNSSYAIYLSGAGHSDEGGNNFSGNAPGNIYP